MNSMLSMKMLQPSVQYLEKIKVKTIKLNIFRRLSFIWKLVTQTTPQLITEGVIVLHILRRT